MKKEYVINTAAPQTQRIYDWQKEFYSNIWFIDGEYCGNCHANIEWSHGLIKFCPKCGFMIVGIQNPNPPEEENE